MGSEWPGSDFDLERMKIAKAIPNESDRALVEGGNIGANSRARPYDLGSRDAGEVLRPRCRRKTSDFFEIAQALLARVWYMAATKGDRAAHSRRECVYRCSCRLFSSVSSICAEGVALATAVRASSPALRCASTPRCRCKSSRPASSASSHLVVFVAS